MDPGILRSPGIFQKIPGSVYKCHRFDMYIMYVHKLQTLHIDREGFTPISLGVSTNCTNLYINTNITRVYVMKNDVS